MKIQDLKDLLIERGFKEEKLDTGINYSKTIDHIELICYIEPGINVSFICLYKWNDNEIKGTYDLPINQLGSGSVTLSALFERAVKDMPRYIGENIDVHAEMERVIDDTLE